MTLDEIDAFVFDFDGVLTNNLVQIDENGKESVICSRADGLAFDVLRKLNKLLKEKVIKRNKKLEYILINEGKLNKKIKDNFLINQKYIALFVTDVFNLIKKSPLKI